MTVTVAKFTPEVMLSAPRRSAAVPNGKGTKALFATTSYSFDEHKKTAQIRVLDIATGQSEFLIEDLGSSEPTWIGETQFLYLKSAGKGATSLMLNDVALKGLVAKTIATFDGGISSLKVKKLANGTIAFACAALATPDGKLANPETEKKPQSSAKIYTRLFVRHWDAYVTANQHSIWYGALGRKEGSYAVLEPGLINSLAGTPLSSPVAPFGGAGDFDISDSGLVFVAKDPGLDPAIYTKTDLYFVPLTTFTEPQPPAPRRIETPGLEGYSNGPRFSHTGSKVAFTRMRSRQYESDKPRLFVVSDVVDPTECKATEFFATADGEGAWDLRPESIVWSADDTTLFVTAEDRARTRIFQVPADPAQAQSPPTTCLDSGEGTVGDMYLLSDDSNSDLLVTSSSAVDNSCYSVVHSDNGGASRCDIVSSNSRRGRTFGLSRNQCSDIWFPGAGGTYKCHALVMKPSDFDESRRYPLCMLIHGGPQGAWMDGWSTRWNPAVFAEQGYVVVAPNPTGSTGYGMALQDGITGEWGGRPYNDLVSCFEFVAEQMPYVDTKRAVALGASYGGFMINWIQGHPLGRKFKALVCHDGVFSTLNQWGTEELFFPIHDFGGTLWENRAGYEKWDPAKFTAEWATPQMIIHSELDYRLPMPEGLAPFNVLQAKGIPSKLLVFPDENHWVLKPENSLVWHQEVLGWINKYSGVDQENGVGELADGVAAVTLSA